MNTSRIDDVRLPIIPADASEDRKRLNVALYDQFRDVSLRVGAIESTLGMTPRRSMSGYVTSPLTTKGDIWTYSSLDIRLAVGANGQYLRANSAAATGLAWTTIPITDLSTFSSSDLRGRLTDETGTGAAVFADTPTFTGTVNAAAVALTGNITLTKATPQIRLAGTEASAKTFDIYENAGSFYVDWSGATNLLSLSGVGGGSFGSSGLGGAFTFNGRIINNNAWLTGWAHGDPGSTTMRVSGGNLATGNSGNLAVGATATMAQDVGGSIALGGYYIAQSNSIDFAELAGRKENGTSGNAAGYAVIATRDSGGNTTEKVRVTSRGNVNIGGSAARATTEPTKALTLFDGTAPVGTLTNGVTIYSTAGEMRVMDAAGNATLLSPHDRTTNEWIYDSVDTVSGRHLRIDVERILRFIDKKYKLDAILDEMQ